MNLLRVSRWLSSFRLMYALCMVILITIPGCLHKKPTQTNQSRLFQDATLDIPVPVGIVSWMLGTKVLRYVTALSIDGVVSFYDKEMDRLGWRPGMSCYASESCLVFEKPHDQCVIIVRPAYKGERSRISREQHLLWNPSLDTVVTVYTKKRTSL